MRVCLGGTFNILHDGHKRLIDKALELAGVNGSIHIGLSIGDIINSKKNINSYNYRRKNVLDYISIKKKNEILVEVLPISTKFGLAVEVDYDVIVVSPETIDIAKEINKKRRELGKNELDIVLVPYVLAEDGKPISSTRILNNEIDKKGKVL
jgi:pantetheine-phosphate adenylyltransferase